IGAITTDYFVAVQQAITFGDQGHAAIVDRKGRVLAHPNPAWRRQMRDISAVEPVGRMMAGETGVTTFFSPAKKSKMIAGFTTVPGVGWGAMIPQPYSELEDRAKDVRLLALAIALGGILVAALISWWLARFLAVPIQAVVRSAREVAGGDSTSRVRVESRFAPMELRELSESFNQMVTQVGAETGKTAKMIAQRNEVVERLAGGASLDTVLRLLVEIAQDLDSGMLGSVFLLDRDRKRLLLGAAPSLPDFYNDAIDGLEIGPTVGSCGAAAYGGERVVVGDVMTHPNWVQFRDLALRAGLRACWSEPIKSASGETLGTFALYYREPREPNEAELKRIVDAANLAGIAITRARTEEALYGGFIRQVKIKLKNGSGQDFYFMDLVMEFLDEKGGTLASEKLQVSNSNSWNPKGCCAPGYSGELELIASAPKEFKERTRAVKVKLVRLIR
ncbi:MAG: GAF domain-containing protein, partial [bacterium]